VIHAYSANGSYRVLLTLTDDCGGQSSCETKAVIGPNLPPICDAGGPYRGIAGEPITFDGTASSDPGGAIKSYAWQFGDCGSETGPNPVHVYANAGEYAVELCVTDSDGAVRCCTSPVVIDLTHPPSFPSWTDQSKSRSTGQNPDIRFPLHAAPGCNSCGPIAVDCRSQRPTVSVPPNSSTTIYLMAVHHSALAAVQTAFRWDPGWVLFGSLFDCLPGQLNAVVPVPPGGPTAGTVATAFDCVTSGELLVLGRLIMKSGASGCLEQVASSYPFGNHAVDCSQGVDQTSDDRWGRICVGGGIDACDPTNPVEPVTWGQVKTIYR
jgi:hypothetical protein